MRILGISGATKIISFGLIDEEKVLAETTLAEIQSEKIMFYVKEAGIKPEQIDGVAVALGPGSYAGLRGSLAAAKALAQSLKVPLAGVSTLEAIAYNLIEIEGAIGVILDARADEYNFALFGAAGGQLKRLTEDLVLRLDRLTACLEKVSGELWLVGKGAAVKALRGNHFHFADEIHSHPYGINVAKIGRAKIEAGLADNPLSLIPRYSHRPAFREFGR